jgi:hypothetical protein
MNALPPAARALLAVLDEMPPLDREHVAAAILGAVATEDLAAELRVRYGMVAVGKPRLRLIRWASVDGVDDDPDPDLPRAA